MKISVEHEVPYSKGLEETCQYAGDFFGNDVCKYHTHRDRTHGRKAPVERRVPKCALFDEWLPGEYQKCSRCLETVKERMKPLTLMQLQNMDEPTPVWWAEAGFWCLAQNGSLTAPSGMCAGVSEMSGTFYRFQPDEKGGSSIWERTVISPAGRPETV